MTTQPTNRQPPDDPPQFPQTEGQINMLPATEPDSSQGRSSVGDPVPPPAPYSSSPSATPPPVQAVPQYSPDGRWLWNGQQWVPVTPAAPGAKSKTTAGILAILLGGLGAHKFYLGQPLMGVLYLLFIWTFIPAILGLIEGIIFLTLSDVEFDQRYGTPDRASQRPFF